MPSIWIISIDECARKHHFIQNSELETDKLRDFAAQLDFNRTNAELINSISMGQQTKNPILNNTQLFKNLPSSYGNHRNGNIFFIDNKNLANIMQNRQQLDLISNQINSALSMTDYQHQQQHQYRQTIPQSNYYLSSNSMFFLSSNSMKITAKTTATTQMPVSVNMTRNSSNNLENRNIIECCDFNISYWFKEDNYQSLFFQIFLPILVISRWLISSDSLDSTQRTFLLILSIANSLDSIDLYSYLSFETIYKNKHLVYSILLMVSISLLQFVFLPNLRASKNKSNMENSSTCTEEKEYYEKDVANGNLENNISSNPNDFVGFNQNGDEILDEIDEENLNALRIKLKNSKLSLFNRGFDFSNVSKIALPELQQQQFQHNLNNQQLANNLYQQQQHQNQSYPYNKFDLNPFTAQRNNQLTNGLNRGKANGSKMICDDFFSNWFFCCYGQKDPQFFFLLAEILINECLFLAFRIFLLTKIEFDTILNQRPLILFFMLKNVLFILNQIYRVYSKSTKIKKRKLMERYQNFILANCSNNNFNNQHPFINFNSGNLNHNILLSSPNPKESNLANYNPKFLSPSALNANQNCKGNFSPLHINNNNNNNKKSAAIVAAAAAGGHVPIVAASASQFYFNEQQLSPNNPYRFAQLYSQDRTDVATTANTPDQPQIYTNSLNNTGNKTNSNLNTPSIAPKPQMSSLNSPNSAYIRDSNTVNFYSPYSQPQQSQNAFNNNNNYINNNTNNLNKLNEYQHKSSLSTLLSESLLELMDREYEANNENNNNSNNNNNRLQANLNFVAQKAASIQLNQMQAQAAVATSAAATTIQNKPGKAFYGLPIKSPSQFMMNDLNSPNGSNNTNTNNNNNNNHSKNNHNPCYVRNNVNINHNSSNKPVNKGVKI